MLCNAKCLQILLLVFNSIIFIAGSVTSGVGIFLLIKSNQLGPKIPAYAILIFITALGFVTVLFGLLGFLGAIKFNKCLQMMFIIVVGITIIGEITGGILLIIYKEKVKTALQDLFIQNIAEVEKSGNREKEEALKTLQNKFKCCGAKGPNDWKEPQNRCCKGCIEAVSDALKSSLLVLGITILISVFTEAGALLAAIRAINTWS
nr:tetraspanin [Hymenolepis microstoma]